MGLRHGGRGRVVPTLQGPFQTFHLAADCNSLVAAASAMLLEGATVAPFCVALIKHSLLLAWQRLKKNSKEKFTFQFFPESGVG